MIKNIHYCWFGGPLPDSVKRNIDQWARLNPDFEIIEWNEGNSRVEESAYGRNAMKAGKWCFVSDVARLQALVDQGGFYLDTDVELYRPLAELPVDETHLVLGYMYNCALGTAFLYAPPQHPVLKDLLALCEDVADGCFPVNNTVFTDYFLNEVPGFLLNGRKWQNELVTVYPKEFFEQPAFIRSHGFSIHHCSGSWMPGKGHVFTLDMDSQHQVKWLKRKINTALALRRNEFYPCYRAALHGVAVQKPYDWRRK